MIKIIGGHGRQPETYKIIQPFMYHLQEKDRNWRFLNIHGNSFTSTLPDKLLIHPDYGQKLIEFKVRKGNTIHLSKNQKLDWPIYIRGGLKFWVIAAEDLRGKEKYNLKERLYQKLFQEPNMEFILSPFLYGRLW